MGGQKVKRKELEFGECKGEKGLLGSGVEYCGTGINVVSKVG